MREAHGAAPASQDGPSGAALYRLDPLGFDGDHAVSCECVFCGTESELHSESAPTFLTSSREQTPSCVCGTLSHRLTLSVVSKEASG